MGDIAFTSGMDRRNGLKKSDRLMVENSDTGAAEWCTISELESIIQGGGLIPATGITLNTTNYTLPKVGDTFQLVATITPSNATNQGKTWSSSKPLEVEVSPSGIIKRLKNSSSPVFIEVTADDGGHEAYCTIPKNIDASIVLGANSSEFDKNGITLEGNSAVDITVNITGLDDKNYEVTDIPPWATVTKNGNKFTVQGIQSNNTGAFRSHNITVRSTADTTIQKQFLIAQRSDAWHVLARPDTFELVFDAAGEINGQSFAKVYVHIEGTADHTFTLQHPAWIQTAIKNDGKPYIEVRTSTTVAYREDLLKIIPNADPTAVASVRTKQLSQTVQSTLFITPEHFDFAPDEVGVEKSIVVNSKHNGAGKSWTAYVQASWVHLDRFSGDDGDEITFFLDYNDTEEARTATIWVVQDDTGISKSATVFQEEEIPEESYFRLSAYFVDYIGSDTGIHSVRLESKFNGEDAAWDAGTSGSGGPFTLLSTNGTGDSDIRFRLNTPNTSGTNWYFQINLYQPDTDTVIHLQITYSPV